MCIFRFGSWYRSFVDTGINFYFLQQIGVEAYDIISITEKRQKQASLVLLIQDAAASLVHDE